MPYLDFFGRFIATTSDLITGGKYYNKKAVLITPTETSYKIEIRRYRVTINQQGNRYLYFDNGFYTLEPDNEDGKTQYVIIQGTNGAVYGFDGNNIWNVRFSEFEKAFKIMTSTNAERFIAYQLFKEIRDRYDSKAELNKYFMMSLYIISLVTIAMVILLSLLMNSITSVTTRLEQVEKIRLTAIAYEYNTTFPEHNIYPSYMKPVQKNETKKDNGVQLIPNLPI